MDMDIIKEEKMDGQQLIFIFNTKNTGLFICYTRTIKIKHKNYTADEIYTIHTRRTPHYLFLFLFLCPTLLLGVCVRALIYLFIHVHAYAYCICSSRDER